MAYFLSKDNKILTYKNKFPTTKSLGEMSWEEIGHRIAHNQIGNWLGQTKSVLINNQNYVVRCVDLTEGRYEKVGGGYTKVTFELTTTLPDDYSFPTDVTFDGSTIFDALQNTIFDSLPSDLRSLIQPIKVKIIDDVSTEDTTRDVQCKLFMASMGELLNVTNASTYNIYRYKLETKAFDYDGTSNDWDAGCLGQWTYYQSTAEITNPLAIKDTSYWTRSGLINVGRIERPFISPNGALAIGSANRISFCFSL